MIVSKHGYSFLSIYMTLATIVTYISSYITISHTMAQLGNLSSVKMYVYTYS